MNKTNQRDPILDNPILENRLQASPYPLIFAVVSGAHLYGFPSPDSDVDIRGVHLLPLAEVVGLHHQQDTVQSTQIIDGLEVDLVTHDLKMFCELVLKKNGNMYEQVFSPLVLRTSPFHDELRAILPNCLTKHHAHHYRGLAESQWALFERDTPRRVKPLLYVYRALLTGIHLVTTGEMQPNLAILNDTYKLSYIPELIEQKTSGTEKGALSASDLAFHEREVERLRRELEAARENSPYPDYPRCKDALSDLLVRARMRGLA